MPARLQSGGLLLAALALSINRADGEGAQPVPIVKEGQPVPIFVAQEAVPEEKAAAAELARALEIMAGSPCSPGKLSMPDDPWVFVGGRPPWPDLEKPRKVAADLLVRHKGEWGPDAIEVVARGNRLWIHGATPAATRYAVSWFLQDYGGVRWYAPGPYGEVIPSRREWSVPEMDRVVEPVYVSREIIGAEDAGQAEWAVRNGLAKRLEYSHALSRVFSREVLQVHPDWRALVDNQRYEPKTPDDYNWQPDLTREDVAAFAAEAAVKAFRGDPARPSFSLGVNDTVRYDQSDSTRRVVEPLHFFRGKPDYSPLVFAFMNRAVAAVEKQTPGHYLGCLAYFWCENPPPFPVNARVIPYVTTDRTQYYDRAYRDGDLELMSRWQHSGVTAYGLWEYAEGSFFLIPRLPYHDLFDAVREGARRGARGYVAEVGLQGGFDTFKVWALARLLWNPELTYDELAADFFNGYYGPAAEPMRRFFEACEKQWTQQTGAPYWLKYYQQEDQALLFPPEVCVRLDGLLAEAMQAAGGDSRVRARLAVTRRAFAVTGALAELDRARRAILAVDASSSLSVTKRAQLIAAFAKARDRFVASYAEACAGPEPALSPGQLSFFVRHDPVPGLLWLSGRAAAGLLAASETRDPTWQAVAEALASGKLENGANTLANASFSECQTQSALPEFLHPRSGPYPTEWQVREMPTETSRVGVVKTSGDVAALRSEGGWDTQVYQWTQAVPGRLCLATARARGKTSPGNDAGLFLSFLNAEGKPVGEFRMALLPKGETDAWRNLVAAEVAPAEAAWVGVGVAASRQVSGDWFESAGVGLQTVAR